MKTRIAFGAGFALAAAFVFVFLQFRAEAIAQQAEATVQEVGAVSQLNEATAQQDGTIAQQAPSSEPLPAAADSTDPFAQTSPFSDSVEETSASYDVFESNAEPAELAQPVPESDDGHRKNSKRRKTDNSGSDPFGSDEGSQPEALEEFGFDTGSDGFESGSFNAEPTKQPPLRIIRFRNVRANDIRSIIRGLFREEADKQRWFLATEDQSNSLICKVPANKFEQIKRLSEGLDRLAATGVDVGKKTQSWPIPYVFDDESIGEPESDSSQWTIRIVRLRFVKANDFNSIARDLALRQNRNAKLQLDFEPTTNTVVMRGPLAEINHVEQLAQQLDQPAAGADASAKTEAMYDATPTRSSDEILDFNKDSRWETLQPPADKARQLREQVALIDQESVQMSNEVRLMQKHYSSQHPKFKSARKNLLTLLEEAFDKRLQLQGIEVALLSSRLKEIESRVQQRAQLRQQIINRRLHELLGEKDDLSWDVVRTPTVLPPGSPGDLTPPQAYIPGDNSVDTVIEAPNRNDTFTRPSPETTEITKVLEDVYPRLPQEPETVTVLDDEPATDFLAQPKIEADVAVIDDVIPSQPLENAQEPDILPGPIADEPLDIVDRIVPTSDAEFLPFPKGAILSTPDHAKSVWQQELVVAENVVEISSLKVERIQSRLKKVKDAEQAEELNYELRLATLALNQARNLLDQKLRWIEAQRNSLKVNIQLQEKNLEVLKNEYKLFNEANEKVPGTVPVSELQAYSLQIEKAELQLQQAVADLKVFEVENQSSRKLQATPLTYQSPPSARKPILAEPDSDLGISESRDSKKVVPAEIESTTTGTDEPETILQPSDNLGEPETPTLEPSTL